MRRSRDFKPRAPIAEETPRFSAREYARSLALDAKHDGQPVTVASTHTYLIAQRNAGGIDWRVRCLGCGKQPRYLYIRPGQTTAQCQTCSKLGNRCNTRSEWKADRQKLHMPAPLALAQSLKPPGGKTRNGGGGRKPPR